MQALRQFGVLDTAACQKSCCSSRWMTQHDPNARHQLVIPNTNDIPFLGSSSLLRKLAVVLGPPRQKARLGGLGCEVDIHMVNGHIAFKIDCFPARAHKMPALIALPQPGVTSQGHVVPNFVTNANPCKTTNVAQQRCVFSGS